MREVRDVPADLPPLTGSAVACLATILELSAAEVPAPPADHPQPWTVWRNWLAERGLGLVPIADPAGFSWAGPWLAVLRGEERRVCAVAYGPPSTIAWHPFGGPETFADVEAGFVVAPHHLVESPGDPSRERGTVEALAIAPAAEAPMTMVEQAEAHAGRGLEGDRYFAGGGTFSNPHSTGHELTLMEAEVVEALGLAPDEARRNVVTRGIDLNALVGERFRVGDVECIGRRLCEPCAHLQRLTEPSILRNLVHRGGLRADLLSGGVIRVGDLVARL